MGLGRLLSREKHSSQQNRAAGAGFQIIIDGTPVNAPTSIYRGGMALPGAWRAALMVSDAIGSVPWDVWEEVDGKRTTKVTPRPLLLEQPAPPDNRMTTFSSWALDLQWHGNAVGLIADRDLDGYPTAVLPIPADWVGVRRAGWESYSGLPTGSIEYQIGGLVYGPDEVLHIKGPCEPSDVRGFGILEAHLSGLAAASGGTLDLAGELQRQARSIGANGVPTSVLKSTNPDATVESLQAAKTAWLAAQRDRTVAVLNAALDFEPLSWNPTEMQLVEARKMSLLETALLFGVQPSALGVETSNRTYRNDNAEDVKFVKWGLRGHLARFEQALSAAFPPGRVVVADLDDYTRPDALTRAQTSQIRIASGTLTPNEDRADEGLPPLPENPQPAPGGPSGAPAAVITEMDTTDKAFLTGMIAHHEAALQMAKDYLAKSDPATRQQRVVDLANNIISAQTSEIDMMQGWLKEAGALLADAAGEPSDPMQMQMEG